MKNINLVDKFKKLIDTALQSFVDEDFIDEDVLSIEKKIWLSKFPDKLNSDKIFFHYSSPIIAMIDSQYELDKVDFANQLVAKIKDLDHDVFINWSEPGFLNIKFSNRQLFQSYETFLNIQDPFSNKVDNYFRSDFDKTVIIYTPELTIYGNMNIAQARTFIHMKSLENIYSFLDIESVIETPINRLTDDMLPIIMAIYFNYYNEFQHKKKNKKSIQFLKECQQPFEFVAKHIASKYRNKFYTEDNDNIDMGNFSVAAKKEMYQLFYEDLDMLDASIEEVNPFRDWKIDEELNQAIFKYWDDLTKEQMGDDEIEDEDYYYELIKEKTERFYFYVKTMIDIANESKTNDKFRRFVYHEIFEENDGLAFAYLFLEETGGKIDFDRQKLVGRTNINWPMKKDNIIKDGNSLMLLRKIIPILNGSPDYLIWHFTNKALYKTVNIDLVNWKDRKNLTHQILLINSMGPYSLMTNDVGKNGNLPAWYKFHNKHLFDIEMEKYIVKFNLFKPLLERVAQSHKIRQLNHYWVDIDKIFMKAISNVSNNGKSPFKDLDQYQQSWYFQLVNVNKVFVSWIAFCLGLNEGRN